MQYSLKISLVCHYFIAVTKGLVACWLFSRHFFNNINKFSMEFKYGQLPKHPNNRMFLSAKKFLTTLLLWLVAPSCMKMLQWSTNIRNCNFVFNLIHFALFVVITGAKLWTTVVPAASDVSESYLSSQSHKPCESDSSKTFSSLSHDLVESSHENCGVTSSHWFASSGQCRVTRNFTFFLHFLAMKWHPTYHKMAPNKFENGAQHAMKWRPISYRKCYPMLF